MTAAEYNRRLAAAMSERDLQVNVASACAAVGALHYHTHDSRRSPEGFPDSTIVAGDRLIFAELKAGSAKLTPAQIAWVEALARCACQACGAPAAAVRVWRPLDWLDGSIERLIRGAV